MPPRRRVRPHVALPITVVALLIASLSAGLAGTAVAASPEERRVSELRSQLEQIRAQRAAGALALDDAEQKVNQVMQAVGAAELAVERQQLAVDQARADLETLQARAEQQREVMAARALTVYKQGPMGGVTVLLDAINPQDALRRSAYADVVSRGDRRAIETMAVAHTAIDAKRSQLEDEEESLARILEDQRALLSEVQKLRDDRAFALAEADQQVAVLESHLEAENRQVTELTRSSTTAVGALAPVPTAVSSGGWKFPASGPITSGYGPRWGRMHRGIDIGAPTGAAIVASKSGVVTYAGVMSGYGNATIVDHGGGYSTLYGHQSAIAVRRGQQVAQGQRIGSVGCTGSCTGPHLHFEIRVNGVARNPMSYL